MFAKVALLSALVSAVSAGEPSPTPALLVNLN